MMLEKVDPSVVGVSQERLKRITRWLEQQVGEGKLAGASALVSRRGKIAYLQCAGFADKEDGKVLAPDTIVRIYSMTKPLTTVASWPVGQCVRPPHTTVAPGGHVRSPGATWRIPPK